jgi:hypothetical protein
MADQKPHGHIFGWLGAVAALVAILTFVTGKTNLWELVRGGNTESKTEEKDTKKDQQPPEPKPTPDSAGNNPVPKVREQPPQPPHEPQPPSPAPAVFSMSGDWTVSAGQPNSAFRIHLKKTAEKDGVETGDYSGESWGAAFGGPIGAHQYRYDGHSLEIVEVKPASGRTDEMVTATVQINGPTEMVLTITGGAALTNPNRTRGMKLTLKK